MNLTTVGVGITKWNPNQ